jgi:DNA-binding CsgD family transcriptional regulator
MSASKLWRPSAYGRHPDSAFGRSVKSAVKGASNLVTTIIELRQLRNCFRCGKEFRGESGKRVCQSCAVPKDVKKPLNPTLSFRERQVVNLICKAKLNKEIAYELHLTEGTVKEYLNRIFRKVGATNRTELAVWAITKWSAIEGDAGTGSCRSLSV